MVEVQEQELRGEYIDKTVKGYALQEYKMKDLVSVSSSSKWKETYYEEESADLTANGNQDVEGIPRLANFPNGDVSWTKKTSTHRKHGIQGQISMEDDMTDDIDVMRRTLKRIARAVTKSVDENIWNTLTENQSPSNINTVSATDTWDAASGQDPIADIMEAKRKIEEENYNPDKNGYLVLSPYDYEKLATWLISSKGTHITEFASEKVSNGNVGRLLGLTIKKSNTVTADYAAVICGKTCGTWKQAAPLTTETIEDKGIGTTVRAWEIGTCQLINPKSVTLITNTQA